MANPVNDFYTTLSGGSIYAGLLDPTPPPSQEQLDSVSVGTVVSYEGLLNKTSLMLHGGVLNVTNGHNIPYVATINKTSIPLDSKQLVFYTQVNTPIIESARVFFIKRRR